jgi:3-oxoacyl-[acyl-carrier-protein] synthase III
MLERALSPASTGGDAIGIRGINYFWQDRVPIDELPQLARDPERLAAFKSRAFRHYMRSTVSIAEQAVRSARGTFKLSGLCAADIDAVIIGVCELRGYDGIQEHITNQVVSGLGFHEIHAVGVNLGGCTNYASLIRMARDLIVAEGYRNVLVVESNKCAFDGSDRLVPPDMSIFSDGAASCVVTREQPDFVIRSLVQFTSSAKRGPGKRVFFAASHPACRAAVRRALRHAGVTIEDIKQSFVPNHGTHVLSSLAGNMGLIGERVHVDNIRWLAHVWSADCLINLASYCQHQKVAGGDLFLLFAYSEASFTAIVVEKAPDAARAPRMGTPASRRTMLAALQVQPPVGIKAINYFGGDRVPVGQLPELVDQAQRVAAYRANGIEHYMRSPLGIVDQAVRSARGTLTRARLCAADIDAVVIGACELREFDGVQETIARDILAELGFHEIHAVGVNLGGCTNAVSLLRIARNMIIAEGYRNVLVIETNRCREGGSDRLVLPDRAVFSDGALSLIVTRDDPQYALRSLVQLAAPLAPELKGKRPALVANSEHVRFSVARALREAGTGMAQISRIYLPNDGRSVLQGIVNVAGMPGDKVWTNNLRWMGHMWSCDTLISLMSHDQQQPHRPGELFLMLAYSDFTFPTVIVERLAPPGATP